MTVALRKPALVGLVALIVLNVTDVITTRLMLAAAHGAVEANPLAGLMLNSGVLIFAKLAIVGLLIWRVAHRPVSVGLLAGIWLAAGLYLATVISNLLILRLLGAF